MGEGSRGRGPAEWGGACWGGKGRGGAGCRVEQHLPRQRHQDGEQLEGHPHLLSFKPQCLEQLLCTTDHPCAQSWRHLQPGQSVRPTPAVLLNPSSPWSQAQGRLLFSLVSSKWEHRNIGHEHREAWPGSHSPWQRGIHQQRWQLGPHVGRGVTGSQPACSCD